MVKILSRVAGFFFNPRPRTFFSLLLVGEEGRERIIDAREKHPSHLDWGLYGAPTQPDQGLGIEDGSHNLGMCPDQESNPQLFGYRMMFPPTEPHWPWQDFFLV